jgi:hypothetical protein
VRVLRELQSKAQESAVKLRKHLAHAEELSGLLTERADEMVNRQR